MEQHDVQELCHLPLKVWTLTVMLTQFDPVQKSQVVKRGGAKFSNNVYGMVVLQCSPTNSSHGLSMRSWHCRDGLSSRDGVLLRYGGATDHILADYLTRYMDIGRDYII